MAGAWIKRPRPAPQARVRLYCIPQAGSGASAFRTWPSGLGPGVEVRAVQLPGREERLGEPPLGAVPEVVGPLADALEAELAAPWALFGHSMGALLGFELLRELRRRGAPSAAHFFASGHRAPQLPDPLPPIHDLPEAAFLDEMDRRYGGVPAAVRASRELLDLLLPGLRADVAVCDTYAHAPDEPLGCPISAFGGTEDRTVSRADLEAWSRQTSRAFEVEMFPGDHFFLQTRQPELLRTVSARLEPLLS